MKYFIDGNQICLVRDDFINLQESPAIFVGLECLLDVRKLVKETSCSCPSCLCEDVVVVEFGTTCKECGYTYFKRVLDVDGKRRKLEFPEFED